MIKVDQNKARQPALNLLGAVAKITERLTGVIPSQDANQHDAQLAATIISLFANQADIETVVAPRVPSHKETFLPGEHSGFQVDYFNQKRTDTARLFAHGGMRDKDSGQELRDNDVQMVRGIHSHRTVDICSMCTGIDMRVQDVPSNGQKYRAEVHLALAPNEKIVMPSLRWKGKHQTGNLEIRRKMPGFDELQIELQQSITSLSTLVPDVRRKDR